MHCLPAHRGRRSPPRSSTARARPSGTRPRTGSTRRRRSCSCCSTWPEAAPAWRAPTTTSRRLLIEFADLLSILTDDPFKPRAYEKAARSVGGYHADLPELDLKGILQIPSVGKSIGEKIHELLADGNVRGARGAAGADPAGRARDDVDPRPRTQEGDGRSTRSWASPRSTELAAAIDDDRVAALKGFGGEDPGQHPARAPAALRLRRARAGERGARRRRGAPGRALGRCKQVRRAAYAGSLRQDARDDRRRRPPGGGAQMPRRSWTRSPASRRSTQRARARRHEVLDRHRSRTPGGPPRDPDRASGAPR